MKLLCIFVGFIGAAIIASVPPDFSNDSQYYVQSGILWARGDVTYAGSLVGSRIFAILYYHLPLVVLGQSIDAISVALGGAFFAYSTLVSVWCFKEITSKAIAAFVAISVIIIGFVWISWYAPLTEQLALVVTLAVLYLLALSQRSKGRNSWFLLITAAALSGIGVGLRSEFIILISLIIGILIFDFSKLLRERLTIAVALGLTFAIAAQLPSLAFAEFTGKKLPPQLTNYFLFFQALHEFGDAQNGPSSAVLATLGEKARATLSQPVRTSDVRLGIGPSFSPNGGAATNNLARDAGIETLRARPREFCQLVLGALSSYLYSVGGELNTDWRSYEERWNLAKDKIRAIDNYRLESSARFGGDATFPVATLFDYRLTAISPVMGGLPIISHRPPASLITIVAIIAILIAIWDQRWRGLTLVAPLYFFSCILLASISQGYVTRYFIAASMPLIVVFAINVGKVISRAYYSNRAKPIPSYPSSPVTAPE